MLKKRLLYSIIPVLAILLIILFLLNRNTTLGPGEPLQAIPLDASAVIKNQRS